MIAASISSSGVPLEQHEGLTLSSTVRAGLSGAMPGRRRQVELQGMGSIDPPRREQAELGDGLRHRVIDLVRPASLSMVAMGSICTLSISSHRQPH